MIDETRLDMAADVAFRRLDEVGGDPLKLAEPLKTFVLVYSPQGVIDNGGFEFLFEADFKPVQPSYSEVTAAYRRIGAHGAASAFDAAVLALGFEDPHLKLGERLKFLNSFEGSENSPLFEFSERVCGDEEVWQSLYRWVQSHAAFGLEEQP